MRLSLFTGTGGRGHAQEAQIPSGQIARLHRQNGHRDPDRLPGAPADCARVLQPPRRHDPQVGGLGPAAEGSSSSSRHYCSTWIAEFRSIGGEGGGCHRYVCPHLWTSCCRRRGRNRLKLIGEVMSLFLKEWQFGQKLFDVGCLG